MDVRKELENLNIGHAYHMKPYLSLGPLLQKLGRRQRVSIARELGIRLPTKPSKQQEISVMLRHMLDQKRIERILLILNKNEFKLFGQLLKKDYIQNNALSLWPCIFMMEQKILFSFYDGAKVYFVVPQEVKTVYRSLDQKKFNPKRARYQAVHRYLFTLSDLYGFFERQKLVEIFNCHNRKKLSLKECNTICDHLCSKHQDYFALNDFMISDYFDEGNIEELIDLSEQTAGLPDYLPTREELLSWEEGGLEMTPQLCALQDYMVQNMGIDKRTATILVEDIDILAGMELSIQEVIHEFEKRDIYFAHRDQLKAIIPLIVDVYNHTRVWSNRGHTYAEIVKLAPRSIPDRFTRPIEASIQGKPVALKAAKDEPCLCGSGKKYKHCCLS